MYLALLLLMPLFLCWLASRLLKWFGMKEALISLGVCIVVSLAGLSLEFYGNTRDTEIWSGSIVNKTRDEVSCSHSYPCNCHEVCNTDSEGHESCSEECDTCYEHSFDVDWNLRLSTGTTIAISRLDSQGLLEPPRWDAAYVGEPTAEAHSFTNYLLSAPDNVMLRQSAPKNMSGLVPPYPSAVHDYYRCNRFLLGGGVPVQGGKDWEWLLNRLNSDLGSAKQVNVIIVLAYTADPTYQYALEKAWVGGKKNDLIVLIGTTKYPKIDWVRIVSWSTAEDLKVTLRDRISAIGSLEQRDAIMAAIREEVAVKFRRRHMKDLKYLAAGHEPSGTVLLIILFLECASVAGVGYAIYRNRRSYNR